MTSEVQTELEEKTASLIALWLRNYRYRPPAYQRTALGGYLALTEAGRYRRRAFMRQRNEDGVLVTVPKSRISAKESHRVGKQTIEIDRDAETMEAIMVKLKAVNNLAYQALVYYYEGNSYREIGRKMNCSHTYARRYKETGFNMVMMEVAEI